MRRMIITTAAVLAFGLALSAFALISVTHLTEIARDLRSEAIEAMENRQIQHAEETLVRLAAHLEDHHAVLEAFCDHEDLHELKGELIDARASIEFGNETDFHLAIYRFGELLEHLSEVQKLTLTNVL